MKANQGQESRRKAGLWTPRKGWQPTSRTVEEHVERAGQLAAEGFECHCRRMAELAEHDRKVKAARAAEVKVRKDRAAQRKAQVKAKAARAAEARRLAAEQAEAERRVRLEVIRQDRLASMSRPLWLCELINPRPTRYPLPRQPEHLEVGDLMTSECVMQGEVVAVAVADQLVKVLFVEQPTEQPDEQLSEVEQLFAGLAVNMNAKGWEVEDQPDGDEGQALAIHAFEAGMNAYVAVGWHTLTPGAGFACTERVDYLVLEQLPSCEPQEGAPRMRRADIAILAEGTPAAPGKPERRF